VAVLNSFTAVLPSNTGFCHIALTNAKGLPTNLASETFCGAGLYRSCSRNTNAVLLHLEAHFVVELAPTFCG